MSKKVKSAKLINKFKANFKCPLCDQSIKVINFSSIVCTNNHTFDIAKQGYINFTTRPVNSNYGKDLFEARNKFIMESRLYSPLHETITKTIKEHGIFANPFVIADLGCGEGSHLQSILDQIQDSSITGIGLDISKEGILMAAKKYASPIWFVGDLAKTPFAANSFHVILNILSPANYTEFKRILVQGGLAIKVVPRPSYLKELRKALFVNDKNKDYQNDHTVSLFEENFQLINIQRVTYTQTLTKIERENLVQMTPLTWSANQSRINSFIDQDSAEITLDLDILIGINKE